MFRHGCFVAALVTLLFAAGARVDAKDKSVRRTRAQTGETAKQTIAAKEVGGAGHRTTAGEGDARIPVVVVRGTPYQMGWHLGRLIRDDMQRFIPAAMGSETALRQPHSIGFQTPREFAAKAILLWNRREPNDVTAWQATRKGFWQAFEA